LTKWPRRKLRNQSRRTKLKAKKTLTKGKRKKKKKSKVDDRIEKLYIHIRIDGLN
jgi:hypothetical protein